MVRKNPIVELKNFNNPLSWLFSILPFLFLLFVISNSLFQEDSDLEEENSDQLSNMPMMSDTTDQIIFDVVAFVMQIA